MQRGAGALCKALDSSGPTQRHWVCSFQRCRPDYADCDVCGQPIQCCTCSLCDWVWHRVWLTVSARSVAAAGVTTRPQAGLAWRHELYMTRAVSASYYSLCYGPASCRVTSVALSNACCVVCVAAGGWTHHCQESRQDRTCAGACVVWQLSFHSLK